MEGQEEKRSDTEAETSKEREREKEIRLGTGCTGRRSWREREEGRGTQWKDGKEGGDRKKAKDPVEERKREERTKGDEERGRK